MKLAARKFVVLFFFVVSFAVLAAADPTARIESIVAGQTQAKVRIGVHITDPVSGNTVYSHNATTSMTPASNMKLVTTAAALEYLGADFLYQTRVGLAGDSLVVIGGGDPLLGDKTTIEKHSLDPRWMLKDIAQQLRESNIAAVSDIIVDSAVFDDQRTHPSWPKDELNRWYACEVSGLNYNGNCVEVIAAVVGKKVDLMLDPQTGYVELINKCSPAGRPPDTVWCARAPGSNVIVVSGACHQRCQPVRVTIARPPAFFGFLLAEEIARAGIAVRGRLLETQLPPDQPFRETAVYRTSLWEVFDRCNKDSFGLAAESLVKTIAASRQPSGKDGGWPAGRQLISQYLVSLGVPLEQFTIDDGSGLSEKNRLSASAITTVLLHLYKKPTWEQFRETLAVGGLDGTIDKYFTDAKYKGRVFGKTGYIEGVKAFSGVCSTDAGDRVFAILTNNANGSSRQAINDIVKALLDDSP